MAVIKIANRCQASGVISQGIGRCQIATPTISVKILFSQSVLGLIDSASKSVSLRWYHQTRLQDGQVPKYKFQLLIPI